MRWNELGGNTRGENVCALGGVMGEQYKKVGGIVDMLFKIR